MENKRIDLTVCACIVHKGKILLLHHVKLNKWLFPGGHIDSNETPDQALVREVMEEASLRIKFMQFSSLQQQEEEIQKLAIPFHTNLHNVGDHYHYGSYYLCTVDDPNFIKNNESKEIRWFSITDLDKTNYLLPSIKQMAIHCINLHNNMNKLNHQNIY